ncbi:glycosyltransferase [Pseudomonas psychrophila]|uniref:glycosyltransferase n=1 Tax=Pseudomonas psychrophila TaxID=122355 RepID=UPI000357BB14|nr:glycosyltransferase [Pseudomonas psychrophila]EPJ96494.1 family 2 glycosyl transferase [Pseudomonas psychrophila]
MKKCCVLIPYYNAGDTLLSAINSIDYDYLHPDVIIVDDGSQITKAADVLKEYIGPLNIILLEMDSNKGIEHALNYGLSLHGRDYELVARLDCGDLCKNNRFSKQVKFLDENPDCYLVGSWVDFTDMDGRKLYTVEHPSDFESIKKLMFINTTFTHPTVIFRSNILDSVGFYPTDTPAAEDYAYFFKIIKKHKASNIKESLVNCTIDPHGISTIKRKRQIKSRILVIAHNFSINKYAVYGIIRSALLLYTPRGFTVFLKTFFNPNR